MNEINSIEFENKSAALEKRIENLDQWLNEFEIKIDNFCLNINEATA